MRTLFLTAALLLAAVRANDLAVGTLEVAVLGAGGAGGEQEGGGEE